MIEYQTLYEALRDVQADAWAEILPDQLAKALIKSNHGTLPQWQKLIDSLPQLTTSHRKLDTDAVQIGTIDDLTEITKSQLELQLKIFQPWRKGPYDLFGIYIDSEWRSHWKWNRLKNHIAPLAQRLILDVGCGNGYHCWRMLGENAKMVIGIDPLLLNVIQFQIVKKLYGDAPIYALPLGIEDLPGNLKIFDTVFSMGVLYHRRSPIDHLLELKSLMRLGGELVLETLVIDGCPGEILVPENRYARMRNAWFIPSCETLISWLKRCGYDNIRLVDVTATSVQEQRTTDWMTFNSLKDFLDAENTSLTVEGLPAPKRAIFIANSA
jgi:tRNA (mo5U34)-methyltransferase